MAKKTRRPSGVPKRDQAPRTRASVRAAQQAIGGMVREGRPTTLAQKLAEKRTSMGASKYGMRVHRYHRDAARDAKMGPGWEAWSIEKRLDLPDGRELQPDAIYVNHDRKIIVVEDIFTGPVEPARHLRKTWRASEIPAITRMIEQGYRFEGVTGMAHPSRLH